MIEEPLHLDPEQFDELVSEVMDGLPEDWAPLVDTMTVVVEDEPSEGDIPAGAARAEEPLGHYRGNSAPVQLLGGGLVGPSSAPPAEIALFQGPLERASGSLDELRRLVHETLVHQIGYHFGYRDEAGDDEPADESDETEE